MGFRQTYKGIFQFQNQAMLERAMNENEAEAMEADAMGLQDSFHSEGVMLLDIETVASEQDWEEMAVAMATLAMHAAKGFLYAVHFKEETDTPGEVEYYEAGAGGDVPIPVNSDTAPAIEDDYFPLTEGATFVYRGKNLDAGEFRWTTRKINVGERDYFYFDDEELGNVHYNDYWDGAYFYKDRSLVYAVGAGNVKELSEVDPNDVYAAQVVYDNGGKTDDSLYAIWKDEDLFSAFVHEGFEDLELPAGSFANCMKVRVELYHVEEDKMQLEIQHQYFAKGIGLVKWERGEAVLELAEHKAG